MHLFDQICHPLAQACIENTGHIMRASTAQNPPYYLVTLKQNSESRCYELAIQEKRSGVTGHVVVQYHAATEGRPASLSIADETLTKFRINHPRNSSFSLMQKVRFVQRALHLWPTQWSRLPSKILINNNLQRV